MDVGHGTDVVQIRDLQHILGPISATSGLVCYSYNSKLALKVQVMPIFLGKNG